MLARGPEGLSDAELLALVVGASARGCGGVVETCRDILARCNGLAGLARSSPGELMRVQGIGLARACAIVATVELSRRMESDALCRGEAITSAAEVHRRLRSRLSVLTQETFWVLALDAKNRVLALRQVAQGSATQVEVHPREVFGPAVREGAAGIIVAHNHPSGDPEPSEQDRMLTTRLKRASEILGIPLLDHVVVGCSGFVSLADRGLV
jgi:DNA repair protein RadC